MRRGWLLAAAAVLSVVAGCGSAPSGSTVGAAASSTIPSVTVSAATTLRPSTTSTTSTTVLPSTTPSTTSTSTTTSTTTTTTTTTTTPTTTITTTTTTTTTAPFAGRSTACRGVALIGDSTAVGLDGANGVLASDQAISTRLAEIGVADLRLDVSGGRSIVETLPNQANGVDAINAIQATGFDGCWVIALGTNDAANIAAGSNADAATRVRRVLDATAGEPVLWLTASTVRADGHWARPNTLRWNGELAVLTAGISNVAVADWDSVASASPWFVADGIHPNAAGLDARSQFIADTLRVFYPG